ncbi:MAG TPA: carotenoid oxygenase family protein [Thermoanaerobaculia bacterium]
MTVSLDPTTDRPEADAEAPPDHAPLLERAFDFVPEEASYAVEGIEGELPAWLRGVYYVNGPARFRRGEQAYRHWLDGDGFVGSLRFEERDVTFSGRFVASQKRTDEEAAGRALYRAFGTGFPGDQLVRGIALASPVNVSVYPFAGRLLAFGEQGLPWELDPETLETRGEHTFGGRLNAVSPFSAHPNFDYETGQMVSFGVSFAADRPTLNLYRFAPDGELLSRRRAPLPYPASIHDFGLTPRFAVVYVNPYLLDMAPLMAEGATVLDCLAWRPELGSSLLVLDRETGAAVASVPIGEGYCLHHVNAHEEEAPAGGTRLVVDVLELEEPVYPDYRPVPDLFVDVAPAHPVRYVVDLGGPEGGELVERREAPYRLAADFPAVDRRRAGGDTDRFWMLAISATGKRGRKFLDRLVSVDLAEGAEVDAWQAPPRRYLGGEPVFLGPRPASRRGAGGDGPEALIAVQEFDAGARASAFLLFDAWNLAGGPVARLPLRAPIPPLFHACYTAEPVG